MAISLKKHLQSLTNDELVEEILKLSKRFKDVKAYFDMELGDTAQQTKLVEETKAKIKKQYFPTRGYGSPKTSVVRQIVSDFRKIAVHPFDVADVLLYRVEQAVAFTNAYGDISEAFYTSTEGAYESALKLIQEQQLQVHFATRCRAIRESTRYIGWGFSDGIDALTEEYLGEEE
jgi:hypothetical protein